MKTSTQRLARRRRGATATGYGLLVGLIAVALIGAVTVTGDNLSAVFDTTANRIGSEHAEARPPAENPPQEPALPPTPAQIALAAPDATAMTVVAQSVPASSDALVVTATNTGGSASAALSASLTGAAFSLSADSCSGSALGAGQSCTLQVTATVSADGPFSGSLSLGGASLALAGSASGFAPELILPGADPLTVAAIADGVSPGACTAIAVSNGGVLSATGVSAALGGEHAAAFEACTPSATPACSGSLAAGETCQLGYRLRATASGSFAAVLTVSAGNAPAVTRALAATAAGFAPRLDAGSGVLALVLTEGNSPGPCTAWTATNTGTVAGLGGATITGGMGAYIQRCTPASGTPCSAAALAPGESCVLGLQLVGTSNYGIGADMTFSAGGQSVTRRVEGTASGFDPVLSVPAGNIAVAAISNGASPGACTPVTVTNTGKAPGLTPASIQFSGAQSSAFQSCGSTCSGALAPGASCTLGVRLATGTAGAYSATAYIIAGGQMQTRTVQGSAGGFGLAVTAATYGGNCGCAADNMLPAMTAACNGQSSCTVNPLDSVGDCAPGCVKNVTYSYMCAGQPHSFTSSGGEAGYANYALNCP